MVQSSLGLSLDAPQPRTALPADLRPGRRARPLRRLPAGLPPAADARARATSSAPTATPSSAPTRTSRRPASSSRRSGAARSSRDGCPTARRPRRRTPAAGAAVGLAAVARGDRRAARAASSACARSGARPRRHQPARACSPRPTSCPTSCSAAASITCCARTAPRALGYAPREGLPRLRDAHRRGPRAPGRARRAPRTSWSPPAASRRSISSRARWSTPATRSSSTTSTYTGALNVLAAAGARLVAVPSDDEGPDLAALERLGARRRQGLLPDAELPTTRPAPTHLARRGARRCVAWSHRAGVPLIEDDYVADLDLDDAPAAAGACARSTATSSTSAPSARGSIPALRIGFVVCPPRAARRALVALKHAIDLGTSALLQHALAEFLERGYLRAHLGARRCPSTARRRDALEQALAHAPAAGHALARARARAWCSGCRCPPTLDSERVFEEAQRRGVLVSPSRSTPSTTRAAAAASGSRSAPSRPTRLRRGRTPPRARRSTRSPRRSAARRGRRAPTCRPSERRDAMDKSHVRDQGRPRRDAARAASSWTSSTPSRRASPRRRAPRR